MWPFTLLLSLLLVGCDHDEPVKSPTASPTASGREPARRTLKKPKPRGAPRPVGSSDPGDAAPSVKDAGGDTAAPLDAGVEGATLASKAPALVGPDGKPLGQTEERPSEASAWFREATAALFRAIKADDPKLAEAFFFPLAAYEQVKDVKDPKRDWERRLIAAFRRDVHDYHRRLGKDPDKASLQGLELSTERTKWMKPRSEGNKLGYFRVTRNRLRYTNGAGREATLEVTSLISWRGEWYLVHLNGFE
jgi:hypothetical protein